MSTEDDAMTIVKILFALFLPPIAAFLQVGLTVHFWLNLLLTLLGVIPGSIHAIWLLVRFKDGG